MKSRSAQTFTKIYVFSVFVLGLVPLSSGVAKAVDAVAVKAGETSGFRNMGDTAPVKAIEGAGFRNMSGADVPKPVVPINSGAFTAPVVQPPVTVAGIDTPGFIAPKPATTGFVIPDASAHDVNVAGSDIPRLLPLNTGVILTGMPLTLVTLDQPYSGPNQTGGIPVSPFSRPANGQDAHTPAEILASGLY